MRAMDDRGGPRQRGDGKEYDFTKPGERLGLFHRPKPGSEATPPPHSKPTLAEVSVNPPPPPMGGRLLNQFLCVAYNIEMICE